MSADGVPEFMSLFAGEDANPPLLCINGRYYRMMSEQTAVPAALLNSPLAEVQSYSAGSTLMNPAGIASNTLWPRTLIGTDALNMSPGVERENGRSPTIMGDAAHAILVREAAGFHGRFLIDDEVLAEAGITDLDSYAIDPDQPLLPDLFLD